MNIFLKRYRDLGHEINPSGISLRPSIRLNTLKISQEDFERNISKKLKLEKISFTDNGYWANSEFALSSTPEYLHGYYYIQEAASQLPVKVLDPKKGDLVLDMCAAPGSKTTQISQAMENTGMVVAIDSNSSRLVGLKNNIERCGITNCLIYQKDAAHVRDLGIKFDKILLDAPCSGNFVTDRDWFEKRTLEGIHAQAKLQKSLLQAAVQVLKPGGILVYSTCSLESEEDEEMVEWALDNLPVQLEDSGLDIGEQGISAKTKLCRRFWPEKERTQGFFIAKLKLKNQK